MPAPEQQVIVEDQANMEEDIAFLEQMHDAEEEVQGIGAVHLPEQDIHNAFMGQGYPGHDPIKKKKAPQLYPSDKLVGGLLVISVNCGNIPVNEVLSMITSLQNKYLALQKKLKCQGVEIMWLPNRNGETRTDFVKL